MGDTLRMATALRVASLSDLPEGTPHPVAAGGVDLVLVRRGADHVVMAERETASRMAERAMLTLA